MKPRNAASRYTSGGGGPGVPVPTARDAGPGGSAAGPTGGARPEGRASKLDHTDWCAAWLGRPAPSPACIAPA
eukprot:16450567-Heterocapsa_arctica.AAC.1